MLKYYLSVPGAGGDTRLNRKSPEMPYRFRFARTAFASIALVALVGLPALALARPLTLDDEAAIVSLASPTFSPDGKQVAFVETRQDVAADVARSSIRAIDVASGAARAVVGAAVGTGDPAWSPDGAHIAYLANDGHKKRQVYVVGRGGGASTPVTHTADGVQQFAWRPDGKALAFVTMDPPARPRTDHRDFFEIGNDDYLVRKVDPPSHLWLVELGTGTRRLTEGTWSLPSALPPSSPPSPISWSPDGARIAFVQVPTTHSGDRGDATVNILSVASGAITKIAAHQGTASPAFPVFSPDGMRIAYSSSRDGDANNEEDVFLADATGAAGPGANVSKALDRNVVRKIWIDARTLLVGGHAGARNAMWVLKDDGTSTRVDTGDVDPNEPFWLDAAVAPTGALAYVGTEPKRPPELWYQSSMTEKPRRLTDVNAAIAALDLAPTTELTFAGPDKFQEDAVVTYPLGYVAGKKYPLVFLPHGGPTAASGVGYSSLVQLLASHGYLVLQPNYRGSDNLGNTYQRAIYMDAAAGPGRDAMAALAALEATGSVDTTKIIVSGWSYGGLMTSWLMAHYHPWKAALSGAAVNDWVDQYDLGDGNVRRANRFHGSPHTGTNINDYRAQSPITDAAKTSCPVLIVSDIGDYRVPITQSYRMYHLLKDNGKDVTFIGIPVDGHNPSDIVRRMERDRLWVDWADRYLRS